MDIKIIFLLNSLFLCIRWYYIYTPKSNYITFMVTGVKEVNPKGGEEKIFVLPSFTFLDKEGARGEHIKIKLLPLLLLGIPSPFSLFWWTQKKKKVWQKHLSACSWNYIVLLP